MKKVFCIIINVVSLITLSGCTKQTMTNSNTIQNASPISQTNSNSTNTSDISLHNKATDCWTIINGVTYNITDYISSNTHPAGNASLVSICGKDGTKLFDSIRKHSSSLTNDVLAKYKVQ